MKQFLFIFFLIIGFFAHSQKDTNSVIKKIKVVKDSLKIDSVSISPFNFKLFDANKKEIDTSKYSINYAKSLLILKDSLFKNKELTIEYQKLPEFLTKTYKAFDERLIVDKTTDLSKLYHKQIIKKKNYFNPLEGLDTNGSISRGITVGNNQDGVLDSNFDLQISGSLSKNVKIRAKILDSNLPQQSNGNAQRLDEFDRVFIELYSKKWRVTAGNVAFKNKDTKYLNFTKEVLGLSLETSLKHKKSKTDLFTTAALVRGKFTIFNFIGQEANQGPYKFTNDNASFLLIIFGSETVYVDGIPLKRGENNDYTVDYNTAEIVFNNTFPITANMRIQVEFQISDQNFTRFVSFSSADYISDKLKVQLNVYSESDAKNQTLQQDLNDNQLEILNNAGDNINLMVSQSAVAEEFIENKIQYKKNTVNNVEFFVFSNDENDELFGVRFNFVGQNQGNYFIQNTTVNGRIYEYISPLNGINQGDYEPIFQLIAPNKLQITTLQTDFNPNKKIKLHTEIALSNNDKNLFSSLEDSDNQGFAGKLNYKHLLIDKPWRLETFLAYETIHENFNTIERIQNVEFNRDWNLQNPLGNQNNFNAGFQYKNDSIGAINYQFSNLDFSESFNGNKHYLKADYNAKKVSFFSESSMLNSKSELEETSFFRTNNTIKYQLKKIWFGGKYISEENKRTDLQTNQLTNLSQRFNDYETFVGFGNVEKIHAEIGYNYRTNDSLKIAFLERVNKSHTYFIKSKLIQSKNANLDLYANYRTVENTNFDDEESLNTRINYRQQLFANLLVLNTIYETSNGTLPQQDFNYVEVQPGQGFYTWLDYNENGIQDLEEFEIAQFQDQATFLRVILPSTRFIKTNKNRFSQAINFNFSQWANKSGYKKTMSHFINQTTILIDSKKNQEDELVNINPFKTTDDNILALNFNFKNSLFFNRGKQKYSTTYSFFNVKNRTVFITGNQENNVQTNQLQFEHKLTKFWLLDLKGINKQNESIFEILVNRNFEIESNNLETKLAYLHNKNTKLEAFYIFQEKNNGIGNLESLTSNNIGVNFQYSKNKKLSLNTTFNIITNDFEGNQNSPVAFNMLEGLQDGRNFTWNVLMQKKITKYLFLNLNYNGRKSETSKVIHVGSVQLRANF